MRKLMLECTKHLLTAGDLSCLHYWEEDRIVARLFVGRKFTFQCDDGEHLQGIISVVTPARMNDGVAVEFLAITGEPCKKHLFFDRLRESQGTPDYYRWFLCWGAGNFYDSKPGELYLETEGL